MKPFVAFLFVSLAIYGQSKLSTSAPVTARPGDTVVVTVAAEAFVSISGVQFDTSFPAATFPAMTALSVLGGNKLLHSKIDAGSSRHLLIGGMGHIANADVLTLSFSVAPDAPAGPAQITFSGALGSDPNGALVTVASPTAVSVTIVTVAVEDLNADGKVDLVDILISVDQALGRSTCGNADLNKDGACDVRDVQMVAKVAN